jgi:hypothetical protein
MFIVRILSSYDEYRTGRVMDDGVGHAAQEEAAEPFASVRGDDHKVCSFGVLFNHRCRIAHGHLGADRIL